jgi:hypothetical protein
MVARTEQFLGSRNAHARSVQKPKYREVLPWEGARLGAAGVGWVKTSRALRNRSIRAI